MWLYSDYVTPEGLEHLKTHRYVPGVYTPLDNWLNPFWAKTTELLPRWLAPNLITFAGFLFVLSSTALFIYHDRTMTADQPSFAFYWAAIAVFLYCQLDAIDGKQARRLGKSTPLGQLFDHGCDCIILTLFTYNQMVMWKLGYDIRTCFVLAFASMFMFYSANWAEYHTHVLVTSNGIMGVTEMEFVLLLFNLSTAIFGTSIWQIKLLFGPFIRLQGLPGAGLGRVPGHGLQLPDHPPLRLPRLPFPAPVLDDAAAHRPRLRLHSAHFRDHPGRPLLHLRVLVDRAGLRHPHPQNHRLFRDQGVFTR